MKKNTLILIGLFVVLLIIAILIIQRPGEKSASSASSGFMYSIDSVAVDKIEIKASNSSVTLEKRGAEWFVVQPINYKADPSNVGNLINQVKNLEIKSVVSDKREKHSLFRVDSLGIQVKIYEKGIEKAAFILGKMGPTYTETYARKYDSDEVLLVQGAYTYMFNRQLKEWRDRTIFTTPRENIKEVKYQYGDTTFTITFKDSIWYVGSDKAKQSVVDGILNSLANIQAYDFVDSAITPKITAVVSCMDTQLRFAFDKQSSRYYVQTSNSSQWFIVDQWKANQILKRKKEIIEK